MSLWEILILALALLVLIVMSIGLIIFWLVITGRAPIFRKLPRALYDFLEYSRYYRRDYDRSDYDYPLYEIISMAENLTGITLTQGARQMLVIPVRERTEMGEKIDWQEAQDSIRRIVEATADVSGPRERGSMGGRFRNSLAVIRAFHLHFCRIPPFCSPHD